MKSLRLLACIVIGVLAVGASRAPTATAHQVPNAISMHAFVKPQGDRLHLVVRVPLKLLVNLGLPRREGGYLDLRHIDEPLERAAAATAKEFEIRADGDRLAHVRSTQRITPPSDGSFETYAQARALIQDPPLPATFGVLWNQGYFDVDLEYPIASERSDFVLVSHTVRALGNKLVVDVRFLPPGGGERIYLLTGSTSAVALDSSWQRAAWSFVKSGVKHILGGFDHLLFLLCVVIPFRRLSWNLLKVITSFTVAHTITLSASALGLVPAGDWFPPLVEVLIAASIIYMAVENLRAPNLKRRWLITGIFGLVHGFGFSFALREQLQLAGDHLVPSLVAFNLGIEAGQLLVLAALAPLLVLFTRVPRAATSVRLVVSALVIFIAGRWLVDRAVALVKVEWPTTDLASPTAARVIGIVLVVSGAGYWLLHRAQRSGAGRRPKPLDQNRGVTPS
jgi:hypothetical protein